MKGSNYTAQDAVAESVRVVALVDERYAQVLARVILWSLREHGYRVVPVEPQGAER